MGGNQCVALAWAAGNENRTDIGDRHAQIAQPPNQLRSRELFQRVVAISGVGVDLGWFQESDLVVVPQCLDTQAGHGGEASDADGAGHVVLRWAGAAPLGSGRSGQYWGAVLSMMNEVTILPSRTRM